MKPVSASDKGPKVLPREGITLAVCYAIIDLGTQTKQFPGKPATTQQLLQFGFEIPSQLHTFDEKKGPQPLAVFQEYSYTCTDRSKLPKVLKSWGALKTELQEITPELLQKYLGAPCMITIEYSKPNAAGKQYANIQGNGLGITRRMQEFVVPTNYPKNELLFLNLDDFNWNTFSKLAPFLQEKIKGCAEWPSVEKRFPMPSNMANNNTASSYVIDDGSAGVVTGSNEDNPFF
jgi:hypothetical protein